jgi:hypothetical protein
MAAQAKGTEKPKKVTWWTIYRGRKPRNSEKLAERVYYYNAEVLKAKEQTRLSFFAPKPPFQWDIWAQASYYSQNGVSRASKGCSKMLYFSMYTFPCSQSL